VRITAIEEDDKGLLTITAEELTIGVSTPVLYPNSGSSGFLPNQGVPASSVNTPLIYEPPTALSGGTPQIWVGASGGSGGVADPNWGGAYVWVSLDNVTYSQVAVITQPLRQGLLTAALPAASGWDAIDTLSVALAESAGVLSGTSLGSAQQGVTRALVDNEMLAYESATLTGANAYNLTGLQRGLDGTPPAAHALGAPFARLDAAIVTFELPESYVGAPLYFKFQSYNVFGAGVESLAACTAYPYTPKGSGAFGPVAQALAIGAPLDYLLASQTVSESDDLGFASDPYATLVDLGTTSS
jgi:hypothetical protein